MSFSCCLSAVVGHQMMNAFQRNHFREGDGADLGAVDGDDDALSVGGHRDRGTGLGFICASTAQSAARVSSW
jgi:hypothetical protein